MASTKAIRRAKKWRVSNAEQSRILTRMVVNNPRLKESLELTIELYRSLGYTDLANKISKKLGKIKK